MRYLNVDLEIDSKEDLSLIVDAFGEDVVTLYNDRWGPHYRAAFEIGGSLAAANENISMFCSLIEALEGESLRLWSNAFSKVFDIGYEADDSPERGRTELDAYTIERIAKTGAKVALTLYPNKG